MNGKDLLHALTDVEDCWIAEAAPLRRHKGRIVRWVAAAACFGLVVTLGIFWSKRDLKPDQQVTPSTDVGQPTVSSELALSQTERLLYVNDRAYISYGEPKDAGEENVGEFLGDVYFLTKDAFIIFRS